VVQVLQQEVEVQEMPTRHVSFRIEDNTFERLESRSRQAGQSSSQVAQTLIEEGLRMETHPGIVSYYSEYRDEIDNWIERVDKQADEAEALWRRQRDILGT
jgi:hypothetical protein